MLADHLSRFRKSANFLDLKIGITDEYIEKIINELVEKNAIETCHVKFILTGGEVVGGIDYDYEKPTFYIFLEEHKPLDARFYEHGSRVILEEYLRDFPEMKTTNYIKAVTLQKKQKKSGALETLYFWQNFVLECSTSNFFIIKNGKLITAKDSILQGITRKVVLDMAFQSGLPIEERDFSLEELLNADEAFLTASFKGIVPVVEIVGHKHIGSGKVGEITKTLMSKFKNLIENHG